jgi:folate-binding protein YgfZ
MNGGHRIVSEERRSPLEGALAALGARWTTRDASRLAADFGDVAAECRAVRESVGVLERNDRACLTAAGPDAARFLNAMVTNDVKSLAAGQGCYATQLTAQGHIVADFTVLAMGDHFLLETGWPLKNRLQQMLERYLIADDVTLEDRSAQLAVVAVEGPASAKLLRAAGAATLPGAERNHTWAKFGETPALVVRLSETGEEGYRMIFVVEYAQNLWDALVAAQKAVPWRPVGYTALNILRTEAGVPWYGAELDERTLPPEAGLEARAISYNKGCYLGQEIIERIRSRGHVNRRLVGLTLETDRLPEPGAKLTRDGKEVGALTTAVDSPVLGKRLALGYVRREFAEPSTRLLLETGAAVVANLPFYRRAP